MTDTKLQNLQAVQPDERLPCRGCPVSCPHYSVCEGRPWRMTAEVVMNVCALSGSCSELIVK